MTDLPKRELGRAGLQVTMLGYGAMELRGAPRARPTTDQQADTMLNAVLGCGHQLHRYLDRLWGKGAPSEGKQRGLQWDCWQRARLDDLLGEMTAKEFILRFTFTNPDLDSTIVGTANPVHLCDNVAILQKGPAPAEPYAEAKRRLGEASSVPVAA